MKKIGYARVSTEDQNLALQLDALRHDGCKRIYQEKITGKTGGHRPTLAAALAARRRGARLGRPLILSPERIAEAQRLCQAGELSRGAIAQRLNIGRTTLWRVMRDVVDRVDN